MLSLTECRLGQKGHYQAKCSWLVWFRDISLVCTTPRRGAIVRLFPSTTFCMCVSLGNFGCQSYRLVVQGDVPNDAGWIETNPKIATAEVLVTCERTVRVTEQVLFPDVLLVVNRLLRWSYCWGLQGIATTYDPSNLLQRRSVSYALSLGRNQLIACIREHSATNYRCMPAGN